MSWPLPFTYTLYLDLAAGRVVIELAPDFAPEHVRNVKALVREHYFDGLAILRVQDNYVAQWATLTVRSQGGSPRHKGGPCRG